MSRAIGGRGGGGYVGPFPRLVLIFLIWIGLLILGCTWVYWYLSGPEPPNVPIRTRPPEGAAQR